MRKKHWSLTQDAFDKLLAWLAPDREQAGERYEEIRCQLMSLFLRWGSAIPEELIDETFNRLAQDIGANPKTCEPDAASYPYLVAKRVFWEKQQPRLYCRELDRTRAA